MIIEVRLGTSIVSTFTINGIVFINLDFKDNEKAPT